MSIKHAILGFLSWMPMTGYELKKLFAESNVLHWSGNSNQIYKTLVELHQAELVTLDVQQQADRPPRKIYTITPKGQAELRQWVTSIPEPPQLRNSFLIQLAWADQLTDDELSALLDSYEAEVSDQLMMMTGQASSGPKRTPREAQLWELLTRNWISFYESELNWLKQVRKSLGIAQKGT